MIIEIPTTLDTAVPNHGPWIKPRGRQERHERAVANTLGWAQEAAAHEAFSDALKWLHLVELVDGALTADWERTQATWRLLVAQQRKAHTRRW